MLGCVGKGMLEEVVEKLSLLVGFKGRHPRIHRREGHFIREPVEETLI